MWRRDFVFLLCLALSGTFGSIAVNVGAASSAVAASTQKDSGNEERSTGGRVVDRPTPISPFSASGPSEIGVAGLEFGMTMQQVAARLVAAKVSYKTTESRYIKFQVNEPIQNLPIEVEIGFYEGSLANITIGPDARTANTLHDRWLSGLVQQYGTPTLTANEDNVSTNVFCHTPRVSIKLEKNANATPPVVFLVYSGALGSIRNLCERAPQSRSFQLAVFPLPNTVSRSSRSPSHAKAVVANPAPVPMPDLAATAQANLRAIEDALTLILESRRSGGRYVPRSAVSAQTGPSDDGKAMVIAGTYRYFTQGGSREASSEFFARFEDFQLKCVRMSRGTFELAPCEPIPVNSEAAKQARIQAERSDPAMLMPPVQPRSWAVNKCGSQNINCIEREYQKVYESIPPSVLIGARSAFQKAVPKANYRDMLDAIVAIDSRQWFINQYVRGSMRDVSTREVGEFTDATGYYGLANDRWVTIRFRRGRVVCIKYWDTASCSPEFVTQYSSTPALSDMELAEQRRVDAINAPKLRYNACIDAANRLSYEEARAHALDRCNKDRFWGF